MCGVCSFFFFSSRRRHTRFDCDWSSDVCSSDLLSKWGTQGSGDGQFDGNYGVAVDGSGNVFVVDNNIHRVQKFDSNGNFRSEERRVGEEGRYRWAPDHLKKKKKKMTVA